MLAHLSASPCVTRGLRHESPVPFQPRERQWCPGKAEAGKEGPRCWALSFKDQETEARRAEGNHTRGQGQLPGRVTCAVAGGPVLRKGRPWFNALW